MKKEDYHVLEGHNVAFIEPVKFKYLISQYDTWYTIVADFPRNLFLAIVKKGGNYTIRIQGTEEILTGVRTYIVNRNLWSEIKNDDHMSIVVNQLHIVNALQDAYRACAMYSQYYGNKLFDVCGGEQNA